MSNDKSTHVFLNTVDEALSKLTEDELDDWYIKNKVTQIEHEKMSESFKKYLTNLQKNTEIALACIYPTPHFLIDPYRKDIAENFKNLPILVMPEYDHDIDYNKKNGGIDPLPGGIVTFPGLGKSHMGIFFSPPDKLADPVNLKVNENIDKKDEGIVRFLTADIQGASIEEKWQNYIKGQDFWFGYMNKISNSSAHGKPSKATPENFVDFAIKSSANKKIDVILPLEFASKKGSITIQNSFEPFLKDNFYEHLQPLSSALITYAKPSNVGQPDLKHYFYEKQNGQWTREEISNQDLQETINKAEKHVRIINPFPLQHQTMLFFMQTSHFCSLTTGTQSTFENIGYEKLPFYQMTPWSEEVNKAICETAKNACGDNCLLFQWLNMVRESSTSINTLAEFYKKNKDELKNQMHQLSDYISKHHRIDQPICELATNLLNNNHSPKLFKMFLESFIAHPTAYTDGDNKIDYVSMANHINVYLNQFPNQQDELITQLLLNYDQLKDAFKNSFPDFGYTNLFYNLNTSNLSTKTIEKLIDLVVEKEMKESYTDKVNWASKKVPTFNIDRLLEFALHLLKSNSEPSEKTLPLFQKIIMSLPREQTRNSLYKGYKNVLFNVDFAHLDPTNSKFITNLISRLPANDKDANELIRELILTPIDSYYSNQDQAIYPMQSGKALPLLLTLEPKTAIDVIDKIKPMLLDKDEKYNELREVIENYRLKTKYNHQFNTQYEAIFKDSPEFLNPVTTKNEKNIS